MRRGLGASLAFEIQGRKGPREGPHYTPGSGPRTPLDASLPIVRTTLYWSLVQSGDDRPPGSRFTHAGSSPARFTVKPDTARIRRCLDDLPRWLRHKEDNHTASRPYLGRRSPRDIAAAGRSGRATILLIHADHLPIHLGQGSTRSGQHEQNAAGEVHHAAPRWHDTVYRYDVRRHRCPAGDHPHGPSPPRRRTLGRYRVPLRDRPGGTSLGRKAAAISRRPCERP